MSQNEPRDGRWALDELDEIVWLDGEGYEVPLTEIHHAGTPYNVAVRAKAALRDLIRPADGTEPVAPGDEAVKTEAPPEPDDPRRWTKWERPWNRRGCSTGYEPMTAPPAPGTVVALRQTSKPYLPTFAPWWYPLTVATFDGETATFVEAPKLKATLTEYPLSTHWAVLAGSGGQTGTPGAHV